MCREGTTGCIEILRVQLHAREACPHLLLSTLSDPDVSQNRGEHIQIWPCLGVVVITVQGCAPCHQHTAVSLVNNPCQQQPREAGPKLSLSCSNSTSTKKDKNSNRNDHVGTFIVRIGFLNL